MNKFTLTNKFVSDTLWLNVSLANKEGEIEIYQVDCEKNKTLVARVVYDNDDVICKQIDGTDIERNDWAEFVSKVGVRHAAWKAAGLAGSEKKQITLQNRVVAGFFGN